VNTLENFQHAFEPSFDGKVIDEYNKNQDFYGKILKDEKFKAKLMNFLMMDIYNAFRENTNT
jgi:type I restriction enzyme R subunit